MKAATINLGYDVTRGPTALRRHQLRLPRLQVLGLGIVLSAFTLPAKGYPRCIPLEVRCLDSDLVVIAKVVGMGQPQERKLTISRTLEARPDQDIYFRKCRVEITEVLKRGKGGVEGAKKDCAGEEKAERKKQPKVLEVLVRALAPDAVFPGWVYVLGQTTYPDLAVGKTYCLLLHRLPGTEEYYLPGHSERWGEATRSWRTKVTRAARVSAWPWGTASRGLRLALLGPVDPGVPRHGFIRFVIAVRNCSGRPIVINNYPPDLPLSIVAEDKNGRRVVENYAHYGTIWPKTLGPTMSVRKIAPGEILSLAPVGPGKGGVLVPSSRLPAGVWSVRAIYRSDRDDKGIDLWRGKVVSQAVRVSVAGSTSVGRDQSGTRPGNRENKRR